MFLVWRLRCIDLPQQDIDVLIRSSILPKITYGYPAFCNMNKTELRSLARLYKRICGSGTENSLPSLGELLSKIHINLFIKAIDPRHSLHGLVPRITNSRYSMRDTRYPLPQCRMNCFKEHFAFKGAVLFNDLHRN